MLTVGDTTKIAPYFQRRDAASNQRSSFQKRKNGNKVVPRDNLALGTEEVKSQEWLLNLLIPLWLVGLEL